MKKILALALTLAVVLSLAALGSAAYAADEPVTVRIGLTGAVYEPIWDVVKEELADEGINLEYVQFLSLIHI